MLNEDFRFVYHYEPMEFNFSKMCNLGVSLATGDYILLLNDDIEITQDNWLEKLMEKAVLPHVGAVGAKLIYPGTEIIQHAGITNIHLGPAHKLQFRSDALEFYFGRNRMAMDVLGVTGACLLVKKAFTIRQEDCPNSFVSRSTMWNSAIMYMKWAITTWYATM